jgi:hypothetical protein
MDFLDPHKERQHTIRLYVGYVLIGFALLLATLILVYFAYGFGLNRSGQVVQNGLVFFSSQPDGANIVLNGKQRDTTNTRLILTAGQYTAQIQRDGYLTWQRAIAVEGGSVQHFDYPFLVPSSLQTSNVRSFGGKVEFATQSRDRRWLLVAQPDNPLVFTLFDLNKRDAQPVSLDVPAAIATANGAQRWQMVEWSTNNRHVLLRHMFDGGSEYILFDREKPIESRNLSRELALGSQVPSLANGAHDQYYVFDQTAHTLGRATLKKPAIEPLLTQVQAFKSHGKDTILYATTKDAGEGKVAVRLQQDDSTHLLRTLPIDKTYLLNLATYSGDWYVAMGSAAENKVYLYKNPLGDLRKDPGEPLVPLHILKTNAPNRLTFSTNTRFLVTQQGQEFYVYDAENDKGYRYTAAAPLDAPQPYAGWMDGHRLTYVSGGKVLIFDFDNVNVRPLARADAGFMPFFDRDYEYLYTVSTDAGGQSFLTRTPLRIAEDL